MSCGVFNLLIATQRDGLRRELLSQYCGRSFSPGEFEMKSYRQILVTAGAGQAAAVMG
jgi:hypothetical protein